MDATPDARGAAPATGPKTGGTALLKREDSSFWPVLVATTIAILVSFAIGRSGRFTAGDDIGYNLGLVGGVMMLLLLLYPARKHIAALRSWGAVKYWFAVHMFLGICGPVLVLAHSTYHLHSVNASVALVCMLVVAGSGIVGRYFYTKVHKGLYGEKLSLQELQSKVRTEKEEVGSKLHFVPKVEARLEAFETYALEVPASYGSALWRFATIWIHRRAAYGYCVGELRAALRATAKARNWERDKYRRRLRAAVALVREFLSTSQRVAQFSVFDRLLELWHVAHVPLVYLLVISGIAHVVYVHMY